MSTPVKTDPPEERMTPVKLEGRLHAPQLPRWTPWVLLVVALGLMFGLHAMGWGYALSVVASWTVYIRPSSSVVT